MGYLSWKESGNGGCLYLWFISLEFKQNYTKYFKMFAKLCEYNAFYNALVSKKSNVYPF